jgi:protein-tyrosine-phosphatase
MEKVIEERTETAAAAEKNGTDTNRPLRVCFVCTGNTCRSPMAAAVTNYLCGGRVNAISCGLYPNSGMPISKNAVEALKNAGIPCTDDNNYAYHTSREATMTLLEPCDRIYGMTGRHAMILITEFPALASKIFTMPNQIADPWGGDADVYKRCLEDITAGVKELFSVND